MSWDTICQQIDNYVEAGRPVAAAIRPCLGITTDRLRVYYHPLTSKIAIDPIGDISHEMIEKLASVAPVPIRPTVITTPEAVRDGWIKVAESRPLRLGLEALQYLPSTTSIPNAPSPVAAMIASSLLGAGLGYGAGSIVSKLTPNSWNRGRLKRNAAMLGGLFGTIPAAAWAAGNIANAKSVLSPWPNVNDPLPDATKGADDGADTVGLYPQSIRRVSPADVNVNALGQVLWGGQASPPTTALAMGTMYAAEQFPDPTAQPGYITGHQLGQLAMAAGQGYVMGKIVGKVLNIATGMPDQNAGRYGAALGMINLALPRLFN